MCCILFTIENKSRRFCKRLQADLNPFFKCAQAPILLERIALMGYEACGFAPFLLNSQLVHLIISSYPLLCSLAALNTWKFALFDLPLGGAKMGVPCDPRGMDIRMQEKLTRKLTSVSTYGHPEQESGSDHASTDTLC